jgi:ribose/xylose/arabinose/galactoside ABC-type transport system permease subunit
MGGHSLMDATARSGHRAQALVIIARAIDLSVGSVLALSAVITAVVASAELPETLAISDRCVVFAGAGQLGAHLHG